MQTSKDHKQYRFCQPLIVHVYVSYFTKWLFNLDVGSFCCLSLSCEYVIYIVIDVVVVIVIITSLFLRFQSE